MTDWLTANSKTAYPFADTDAYDDVLTPIVDGVVSLITPVDAYLSQVDTVAGRIQVTDVDGGLLVDSDDGSYAIKTFGAFEILSASDQQRKTSCALTVEAGTSIEVAGLRVPFAVQAHDFSASVLRSIGGFDQTPVLAFGQDFVVERDGDRVVIGLRPVDERLDASAGDQYLYTINGVEPTNEGAFSLEADINNNCHRFTPEDHLLAIRNICKQCCQCAEYYSAYTSLQGFDEQVAADIDVVSDLMTRYHDLVVRWENFLQAPEALLPQNTDTTARGWVGGTNSANSISMLVRFIPGTYGGVLSIMVLNGLEDDITTLELTVTCSRTVTAQSSIIQPSGARDPEPFDGFPGTVIFDNLASFQSVLFSSSIYNRAAAGSTAFVDVVMTATTAEQVHDLTLTLPAIPFNLAMRL